VVDDVSKIGIANAKVNCYSSNNKLAVSTTTDASGNYKICGLVLGDYTVRFSLNDGYIFRGANFAQVNLSSSSSVLGINSYAYKTTITNLPVAGMFEQTVWVFLLGCVLIGLGVIII
jgi:hypothetical protein